MKSLDSHFHHEKIIQKDENCAVLQLSFAEGNGTATVYPLFRGVELIAFDVHAPQYLPKIHKQQNILEINYCFSGRAECKMADGCLQYIGQGDTFLTTMRNHSDSIELPLGKYSGITLCIDFDRLDNAYIQTLLGETFQLKRMLSRFLESDQCFFVSAREATIHFFADLSFVDQERLPAYYRLKALELMLLLENINPKAEKSAKAYTRNQVNIIKQVETYLTDNLKLRITIEELSQSFCISATSLKTLFKEVYGKPISIYMKEYRIQKSKDLLTEPDKTISEVASLVGYHSQSKFGAVFREMTGLSPNEYRNQKQQPNT